MISKIKYRISKSFLNSETRYRKQHNGKIHEPQIKFHFYWLSDHTKILYFYEVIN